MMGFLRYLYRQPLLATSLNLSRIMLFSAESLPLTFTRRALGLATRPDPSPPENYRQILRSEVLRMLGEDYENIRAGLYTMDHLFSDSAFGHGKRYFRLWKDSISAARRAREKKTKEFSSAAKSHLNGLPEYYTRNFHFQTDGYLSPASADLYEHQTEILFLGTLGLMRRLLLTNLILKGKENTGSLRILEIGAGTGETTEILCRSLPHARVEAIDLSEPYLLRAKKRLKDFGNVKISKADGLKFRSAEKYDMVVTSYCLHEMPLKIRKNLIKNAAANLKRGGHLLVIDSLQLGERPEFDWALKQFPKDFHEPFYTNYVKTPLPTLLDTKWELVQEQSRFLSKSLLARKL